MGLFKRKPDVPEEVRELIDTLTGLSDMWDKSPGHVIHHFLRNSADPLTTLAHAIVLLVADQTLKPEDVRALGIDAQELQTLVGHITGPHPAKAIRFESEVAKAVSEYEGQIDGILSEAGVVCDAQQRTSFRSSLAKFAHENKINDLRIAYRLMKAEGKDPLDGATEVPQNPGYL